MEDIGFAFVLHFRIVIPCLFERVVTHFNVIVRKGVSAPLSFFIPLSFETCKPSHPLDTHHEKIPNDALE